jgi:DNA-binding NarL/FixJ family response regulator
MSENIRILLVDDHLVSREELAMLLHRDPEFDIVGEASDGKMAVELTQKLHPDVVIMDVRMPVMNGLEATRLITAEYPDTKVIGFTMHSEEGLGAAMQRAGAKVCISKSDPAEVLISAIHGCRNA